MRAQFPHKAYAIVKNSLFLSMLIKDLNNLTEYTWTPNPVFATTFCFKEDASFYAENMDAKVVYLPEYVKLTKEQKHEQKTTNPHCEELCA